MQAQESSLQNSEALRTLSAMRPVKNAWVVLACGSLYRLAKPNSDGRLIRRLADLLCEF
jgi:hypothetical protein